MKTFAMVVIVAACGLIGFANAAETQATDAAVADVIVAEIAARPRFREPPAYPAACAPHADASTEAVVSMMFDVDEAGAVNNVRVRESSDACFNDSAASSLRSWRYHPRLLNGEPQPQEDLEVTVRFALGRDTTTEDFDARPFLRVPPQYPGDCMQLSGEKELVILRFDVDANGETRNIAVVRSSHKCLNKSAIKSVSEWRYRPKIVGGEPVERRDVETGISYVLEEGPRLQSASEWVLRNSVRGPLKKAQRFIMKEDTTQAQAILEQVRREFGDTFNKVELSEFHKTRGALRINTGDYRGALDDMRIVLRLGAGRESMVAVADTVENLEKALGVAPAAPDGDK